LLYLSLHISLTVIEGSISSEQCHVSAICVATPPRMLAVSWVDYINAIKELTWICIW